MTDGTSADLRGSGSPTTPHAAHLGTPPALLATHRARPGDRDRSHRARRTSAALALSRLAERDRNGLLAVPHLRPTLGPAMQRALLELMHGRSNFTAPLFNPLHKSPRPSARPHRSEVADHTDQQNNEQNAEHDIFHRLRER